MDLGRGRRTQIEIRSRAAVLHALAAFVLLQLVTTLVTERWQPRFRDPEYGRRLNYLRQQVREHPDRPLAIVMGSSRVGAAVRPEVLLSSSSPASRAAIVFNYCMGGSGPVMQLCLAQRLLEDGVHPDLVCVECWAP